MADREMLDRWAAALPERRAVEAFLEWAQQQNLGLADGDGYHVHVGPLLDQFHGIDQKQLERERAALLDAHRETTGQEKA